MADMLNEDRKSIVLEGMYKGVAGKIDEVKQSVCKELQFSSAQQASAYESIEDILKANVETMLAEIRYLSQQNSAIYDFNKIERTAVRDEILKAAEERAAETVRVCTEQLQSVADAVQTQLEKLTQSMNEKIEKTAEELGARLEERAAALKEELVQAAGEAAASAAETVTQALTAEKEELVQAANEAAASAAETVTQALTAEKEGKEEETSAVPDGEALAESVAQKLAERKAEGEEFNYDVLAEKISTVMPEIDYDAIAERVAAAIPQTDENAVADKVAAAIPQTDENAIADRVAESIPLIDYDLIAERVAAAVANNGAREEAEGAEDGENEEKFARAVERQFDYEKLAARVAELLRADESDLKRIAAVVAVPSEKTEEEDELAVAVAEEEEEEENSSAFTVAAIAPNDDRERTIRYKRSFVARISQSDEAVKENYSALKNALMGYTSVRSQINWTNDRFSYGGETVAKIAINGKALCLYLALDPSEFPVSVYHQKNAGDKKMYERTPMMVKIKSQGALKRALRLVGLLMEGNGAAENGAERVDYAAMYPYRSDEDLLGEGLIKTSLMLKSDLNF